MNGAHGQAFRPYWGSQKTNFQPFITSQRNIERETINASTDRRSVSLHTGTLVPPGLGREATVSSWNSVLQDTPRKVTLGSHGGRKRKLMVTEASIWRDGV